MKLISARKMFCPVLGVVATVLLSVFATAQGVVSVVSPRRVLTTVDAGDRVTLNSSLRPWVTHAKDLGAAPGSTAASRMVLLLSRSREQQQALAELLADLQNPTSPHYHHWLTPSQFGESFGVNNDDLQSVTSWLQSQGFTITRIAKARNLVEFSGNVAQVQQAFNTQIHRLSVDGEQTMTSVTPVQVPRALAPVIKGLVNLESAKPHASITEASRATYDATAHRIRPDLTLFDSAGTNPVLYMDPADAATVYNTPNALLNANYSGTTLDGTGVNVGIVGASNVDLTAVSNYRQAFLNETASNVNLPTIVIDGSDPGYNGAETESFLDLEVLGGVAPGAKLYYYTSDSSDLSSGLVNAIGRAIEDNVVSILSISYSSCESNQGAMGNALFAELYQQADAQGITITVSSGDSGPANCDSPNSEHVASNGLVVNALGSTPYNISVGGTDFDVLASDFSSYVDSSTSGASPYFRTALKYIPERPWNDSTHMSNSIAANVALTINGATNIIAAGSGVSSVYSKPDFQTALTPADGARDMPDVSFLAANGLYGATWVLCEGGILGYDCLTTNGQFTDASTFSGAGGTSASTPAFAGMLALVEQSTGSRLGQANDVLYRLAANKYSAVFHDVTAGDNAVVCQSGSLGCGSNGFTTGYDAAPGYDLATGLGSVDVAAMVSNWSSAVGTTTATTLTINGATTPVTVNHGTSLTIDVAVSPTTANGSAALVANTNLVGGQLAIPLTNGVGSTTYNGLPGGTYTLYARYSGDASDAASSSAPISINIAPEASTTTLNVNTYTALTGASIPTNNAIPYGSYIFSDAFVFGTAEGPKATQGQATGMVTFLDNGAAIGTGDMTSLDFASFPGLSTGVYPFTAGTHTLTASYAGDASYQANTSAPVTFTVLKGQPQIVIVPASIATNTVTNDIITVNLATSGLGAVPTGTVTLQANGTTLGSTSTIVEGAQANGLVLGFATITIAGSQLQQGANTLVATYTGDGNYTGGTANIVVTNSKAAFSLATSPLSLTAGSTTGDTTTVRVTPLNDFTGVINLSCAITSTPAGAVSPVTCAVPATVNVSGLGSVAGTLTVNSTASTTGGDYVVTLTGVDALTGKLTATTTSAVTVTGANLTPALTLSSSGGITIAPGASSGNTSVIAISSAGGFTGAVALSCAITSSPAGAVDAPTCSLSNQSVTLSGSAAATSTVTINSTAASTAQSGIGGGIFALLVMLVLLPLTRRRLIPLVCLLALGGLGMMTGCSSSSAPTSMSNPGTTAGAYVVTIFGTASNVAPASTTVSVTVN